MIIKDKTIDGGKGFDWGKISFEYAKYRDIYPQEFYQKILDLGLCTENLRYWYWNWCFAEKFVLIRGKVGGYRYFSRAN